FLDRAVFNREAAFLAEAQRFARVLRSRNTLLREPAPDPAQLDVYDAQLADAGARILAARQRYLAEIGPGFTAAFQSITQSGVAASLRYEAEVPAEELATALAASRRRDLARRQTHVGPHVDHVVF